MKEILIIIKCVLMKIVNKRCKEFSIFRFEKKNCLNCAHFKTADYGKICVNNVNEYDCIKNNFKHHKRG